MDLAAHASVEDALSLVDSQVWPGVQREYGRLLATPGVVAAALATIGIGGLFAGRQRNASGAPRLLGKLEPRNVRRKRARRRWLRRLRTVRLRRRGGRLRP